MAVCTNPKQSHKYKEKSLNRWNSCSNRSITDQYTNISLTIQKRTGSISKLYDLKAEFYEITVKH